MALVNSHFLLLPPSYLFADIAKKVNAFKAAHPELRVISLGIGDVTRPLCPAVIEAMHRAVDEMSNQATFRGYGPEQGYDFLRQAIVDNDFKSRGIDLDASEVFVSDGAKSDTGNFQELLSGDTTVAVTDPIYPVYIDSNVMAGRAGVLKDGHWTSINYMPCTADNGFVPQIPERRVDAVYLCYPNNPTGTVASRQELKRWVDYALKNDALILYDAAYEAFISDSQTPHSIYEIEGAKQCAVEFHSFSKTAGFTGVRCGYTVVPHEVTVATDNGERTELNRLWLRRQTTKFNGTSYISQRAAEAIYTPEGKAQTRAAIDYYMHNAQTMLAALKELGLQVWGGQSAPYLWVRTPGGELSWQFFERMLNETGVVCTPGVGFGPAGEGYIRLTAFGTHEDTAEALNRLKAWLGKN